MERALVVKAAVRHAWQNYKQKAWGADEIKPILGTPEGDSGEIHCDIFTASSTYHCSCTMMVCHPGLALTLISAMDTLWMVGLREEFNQGAHWVASFDPSSLTGLRSFFGICTRVLGGLLSAHQLSQDPVPLRKATIIADRLFPLAVDRVQQLFLW
jgi:hypothetical protein